jgi:hypothetical protein
MILDAAKLMKPRGELNLNGRMGMEWVLLGFEGGGSGCKEEKRGVAGAAEWKGGWAKSGW